ncbi:DUF7562 family protein [Natrialba swarupiae]|uniref:Small CPxCG-related zinc finger protein n=1 Tax=Natrialba swarupiae TaxID=2448032 RepID=A0A5D5ANQ7_9EURY|nr:hypothetical protein [Natrialba swarupiae]TYT62525.1 hypothetical protein FYC77_08525 [Natrialba swarupiae]
MWPFRTSSVVCLACGTELSQSMAREYDKYGDRWDRANKTFEHLCKGCHSDLCPQPRGELEKLLGELEAGNPSQAEFLSRYVATVDDRYGPLEES